MKEKLTNNLAIKLIALFCAFFVWLAVVNVANPIKVSTREVPVTITNDQVLEQADLAYDVVGKKTAVISFKIRTKDDYKVKASDFNAYADLSEMYDVTGAIPIRVEVVNNEELLESTPVVKSPEVIKITTEALQTKAFTLKAYPQGEAADGYEAGEVTMVPSQVTVKGPTSLIGQISSVGIRFNIDGAVADVSGTATPEYFDANGNVLSDLGDSVKTVGGDVSYTMQILKVKEVRLILTSAARWRMDTAIRGRRRISSRCLWQDSRPIWLRSARSRFRDRPSMCRARQRMWSARSIWMITCRPGLRSWDWTARRST